MKKSDNFVDKHRMQQTLSKYLALRASLQHRLSVRARPVEIVQLSFALLFGIALLGITLEEALLQTLLLFVFVTFIGKWLAHKTANTVGDRNLRVLSAFWLMKLIIILLLLNLGWIPELHEATVTSGYDPYRYYIYSQMLLQNNWEPVGFSLNYLGIVYYYAVIFAIIGVNPVVPALVNALVTFAGTLFIIRAAYSFTPHFNNKSYRIAWLVLIPEVLWFDVMTSRETLMAVLLAIVILGAGSVLTSVKKINVSGVAFVLSAMLGILAIRTSMILPVVVSIGMMVLLIRNYSVSNLISSFGLIALVLGALLAGPIIHDMLGGNYIDYLGSLSSLQNFEDNIASDSRMSWSDNSIGLLLVPNSFLEMFVFVPARMVLYLAAPLPNIAVSLSGLVVGEFSEWERIITVITSALMLLGFPYVLAGSAHAWRNRIQFPALLVIPIGFWITFAAVAGGNIIIHERYRLMCTLLLFACMWLGFTQSLVSSVKYWAALWYGLLAVMTVFYMAYKFF